MKIPILLVVLIGALLLSLLLNVVSFNYLTRFYRERNATRLDPFGLAEYPTTSPPPQNSAAARKRVVFIGDSRAYQWPFPTDTGRFEYINRGIGGQTSTQVLGRFEAHLAPLQPQVIVLQVGVNDLKELVAFPGRQKAIQTTCEQAIQQMVAKAQELDATIILTTIFPLGDLPLQRKPFWWLFWSDTIPHAITEVNSFVLSLQSEKVIILDAAAILADERGLVQKRYQDDLLHINQAGYVALNQELSRLLLNIP